MKINISANIRSFRKERNLTQEQLAEIFGVTLGAVSKWELGASKPDLILIIKLAEFFETSVDVLLGYELKCGSIHQSIEKIKRLRNEKQFEEATAVAEKALQKYPNNFEIAYQSAIFYSIKGLENQNQISFQRALFLFERALELIRQNTNERINDWTIRNQIANIYISLGRTEEALQLMKENNADGLNNGQIGYTLATVMQKTDEALAYLSDALIDSVMKTFRVVIGFANAYSHGKDYISAISILLWMRGIIEGLKKPSYISYLDNAEIQLLTACAIVAALDNTMDQTREYLRNAKSLAERFDANPEHSFFGTKFFHGENESIAFDDFGETTLEGIQKSLIENDETGAKLLELFDKL